MKILTHQVLYEDPDFYASFPTAVPSLDGGVLLAFRRAPDHRRLLPAGDDSPEIQELRERVDHLDPRSQLVTLRLDRTLQPVGGVRQLQTDPLVADQDPSLLRLDDGRLLMGGFSWYPIPGDLCVPARARCRHYCAGFGVQGQDYLFWGGWTQYSDDDGENWEGFGYLPPLPGHADVVADRRLLLGGAVRGQPVQLGDALLLPTYSTRAGSEFSSAHLYRSDDRGGSWRYHGVIARDGSGEVEFFEPSLWASPDGRLIAYLRTYGLDDRLATARSDDGGRTWSDWSAGDLPGHPWHPLDLPDGRVLLVYGYRHPPYGIRGRVYDPLRQRPEDAGEFVIRDDGDNADLGYPWSVLLPGGNVLVVYYFNRGGGVRHIAGTVLDIDAEPPWTEGG